MTESDDDRPEALIQINFCKGPHCWKKQVAGAGNMDVLKQLAAANDTSVDELDGKTVQLAGHSVRIECHDCLKRCLYSPRVNIIVGEKLSRTRATSLEMLEQKLERRLSGEWPADFE